MSVEWWFLRTVEEITPKSKQVTKKFLIILDISIINDFNNISNKCFRRIFVLSLEILFKAYNEKLIVKCLVFK